MNDEVRGPPAGATSRGHQRGLPQSRLSPRRRGARRRPAEADRSPRTGEPAPPRVVSSSDRRASSLDEQDVTPVPVMLADALPGSDDAETGGLVEGCAGGV